MQEGEWVVAQGEDVEESGASGVGCGQEGIVGGEGAVEELGPDVEGLVGEVSFHADQVVLFFCRFGFVVQERLESFGETALEAQVARAVERRCCFLQISFPVSVMPCQRCAEIVVQCVDAGIAAGELAYVAAISE